MKGREILIKTTFNDWEVYTPYKKIAACCVIENHCIRFKTVAGEYSLVKVQNKISDVIENSVYQFITKIQTEKVNYKLVVGWYDKNGALIERSYLENECERTSPIGTVSAELAVIVSSKEAGFAILEDMRMNYIKTHEQRYVTLLAVTLAEKTNKELEDLTLESQLNEFVTRIDEILLQEKPDIILLTEHFHNANVQNLSLHEKSLTLDSRTIKLMCAKAKEHKVYLAFSIHENRNEEIYNTAILIDRIGNIVGTYSKTHLTLTELEMGIVPGDKVKIFDTDFGKVGFLICWDMWFPTLSQMLYENGAEIILNPTLGPCDYQASATAYLTGTYIVRAFPRDENATKILNPMGDTIDNACSKGYAVAKVDLNRPCRIKNLAMGPFGCGRNIYRHDKRTDLVFEE